MDKKRKQQMVVVFLFGAWLTAAAGGIRQTNPAIIPVTASRYAGIAKQLRAPKLDTGAKLVRLSNMEIPSEKADAAMPVIQPKERQPVEIAGVIDSHVLLVEGKIAERKPKPVDVSKIPCNVPNDEAGCKSSVKTHMSYRAITCKSSPQYKLQQEAVTDPDSHIRMSEDCYLVAVGTGYADHVGQKLRVTMTSGMQVTCMVGEFKSDRHTDPSHRYHVGGMENGVYYKGDGSVIEFITDTGYQTDDIPEAFDGTIHNISVLQK